MFSFTIVAQLSLSFKPVLTYCKLETKKQKNERTRIWF